MALAGCGRGSVKGPETRTTSARITSTESAVERITAARCDREQACDNVGAHKSYETRATCEQELGNDKRADLSAAECPRGISEPDLNDCLHGIRTERCGNPLDSLSRLAVCRKGKLCLDR